MPVEDSLTGPVWLKAEVQNILIASNAMRKLDFIFLFSEFSQKITL